MITSCCALLTAYQWNDGHIIALFVVAGVLLLAFAAVQVLLPDTATLPPRLFNSRSVLAALWNTLCVNCGNYVFGNNPLHTT